MKQKVIIVFYFMLNLSTLNAQKIPYIPNFLLDPNNPNSSQFSWDKTYQSTNFTIIWGNTVGTNPITYTDSSLAFNPLQIANYFESIYASYKSLGFLVDTYPTLKMAQYKVPIIMNNTWGTSPGAITGWAYGSQDNFMPFVGIHPLACNGGEIIAHEFAHCLQMPVILQQLGTNNTTGRAFADAAGIYFETHAEFMASQIYPNIAEIWGMDSYPMLMHGDWKNTYRNYPLLYHMQLKYGINRVNNLWFQQFDNEYPIATYKRISNFTQSQLNDDLYEYARRMPTLDFGKWTSPLHNNRESSSLNQNLIAIQNRYTILSKDENNSSQFRVPIEQAPEEYGYNIIPLHFTPGTSRIKIKFKGVTDVNPSAGWRYGFVAEDLQGQLHSYGAMNNENEKEFAFQIASNMGKVYLVVMGAPVDQIQQDDNHNTWTGYPKHYRYPYEVALEGAVPEGYQSIQNFRAFLKQNPGSYHPNGGGWVAATATVSPSVFVASHAIVLGNSQISGTNTRIEGTAVIRNATIRNNVHIKDNAIVNGGTYSADDGSLVEIKGNAFSENNTVTGNARIMERARVSNYNLSGTVLVGGDVVVYANQACNNGVYRTLTNYYANNPLACDNRTELHPTNVDVNNNYINFTPVQMSFSSVISSLFTFGLFSSIPVTAVNNGSPITSYTATVNPGNLIFTSKFSPIPISFPSNETYTISVTATNAIGTSVSSDNLIITAVAATGPVSACSINQFNANGIPFNSTSLVTPISLISIGKICPSSVTWQGVTYPTVTLQGMCWMKQDFRGTPTTFQNLATTSWLNSSLGDIGGWGFYNATDTTGASGWANSPIASNTNQGYLYQWSAAMNGETAERSQGVCPSGWHLPSAVEFSFFLHNYAAPNTVYNAQPDSNCISSNEIGNAAIFHNLFATTPYLWRNTNGSFGNNGMNVIAADLWSSSSYSTNSKAYKLYLGNPEFCFGFDDKSKAMKVRCIKD